MMPGQGWAGSRASEQNWWCALCLKDHKTITAVTQLDGTLVCAKHVHGVDLVEKLRTRD